MIFFLKNYKLNDNFKNYIKDNKNTIVHYSNKITREKKRKRKRIHKHLYLFIYYYYLF